MTRRHDKRLIRIALLAGLTTLIAACNTTPVIEEEPRTVTRIDMPDAFGFTITEESIVDETVRLEYDRAVALLAQGNTDAGISMLESIVESEPGLSAPHIDLAVAYHAKDDLEAAEKHLNKALEINPSHPMALNELGIVYRKTARFAEARASYEAALEVYPNYHFARRNLGVLCDLYLDDAECAVENYEAYMATVDSDDEADLWLKNARFRAGQTE